MHQLFTLLFFIIGLPVLAHMVIEYVYKKRGESRKARGRASCPPHQWILIIDDIQNMHDILICKECGYRNTFNN